MKFSLRFNNDRPVAEYIALAQAAEQAGFDQFWVSDDLFLRSAVVILAAVAQATERIEIGCLCHTSKSSSAARAEDDGASRRRSSY